MRVFSDRLAPEPSTRILDIGGTARFWAESELRATLLNRTPEPDPAQPFPLVRADATAIPFPDSSFDIVFSNSMIEHVRSPERQKRVAEEAMRVGTRIFVQTPNYWFPIEPHFLTPLIHWLPKAVQKKLVRNCTVWGWVTRPSREFAEAMVDEIALLSARDLRKLFPGCRIVRERFLGLTKSLIVLR